uniref:Uncharacterized protein n=1 Tax=Caenorhabditis japonica TaxID=281687 RepID=A0A8R1EJ38_CAEJA
MFAQASPKPRPTFAPCLARLRSFKSSPTLAHARPTLAHSPAHRIGKGDSPKRRASRPIRLGYRPIRLGYRPNVCPLAAKNYVSNNSLAAFIKMYASFQFLISTIFCVI